MSKYCLSDKLNVIIQIEEDLISVLSQTEVPEEQLDWTAFGIVLDDAEEKEN